MNENSPIEKFVNFIGGLPTSRVALFAAALTFIYWMWFYDNGDKLVQDIETSKSQLSIENNKKVETQKVLQKEQQMRADVAIVAKKYEEIKAKIPLEFTETDLRAIIDTAAKAHALLTTKSDRQAAGAKSGQGEAEKLIDQFGLNYEFEGSYANIAKFVKDISNLEKLIRVGDFRLNLGVGATPRAGSSGAESNRLTFRVAIVGFRQSLEAMKPAVEVAK